MQIPVTWRAYVLFTLPAVVLLATLGILALFSTFHWGHGTVFGLVRLFLLNAEGNIPTFFSSLNLLIGSALLIVVGASAREVGRPFALGWGVLGLLTLFVAIDEAAQIHELLDHNRAWPNGLFEPDGVLAGPWVVVYGTIAVTIVIGFARFFLHLPLKYKWFFSSGAAMFVGAAIGLEMVGAEIWTNEGKSFSFEVVNWAEEVFEMLAVVIVNASLLSYIQQTYGSLAIRTG